MVQNRNKSEYVTIGHPPFPSGLGGFANPPNGTGGTPPCFDFPGLIITGDAADCNIFRQILERVVSSCNCLSPDRGNLAKSKLKLCFDLDAAAKR